MSETLRADRHVHPGTIPLRFLKEAPSTVLGLPAAYAVLSRPGLESVIVFTLTIAGIAILFQWLSWHRFRYGIAARELVIESGIFSRTRRSIPFERIQDVDIEQGPLARLFGLTRLNIQTGGSTADEGVLDSVSIAEAQRLRDALRTARRGLDDTTAEADEPAALPLFEMSVGRVLVLGLFNFSMVYLAGIFALLQAFDSWLPFDVYDPGRWIGIVDERLKGRLTVEAVAAVALLALLLGVIAGVARTLAREFGFRLRLEQEGLRRQRGLFTRTDVLIPAGRVELALLDTGPIRRKLGWRALSFQTLGAGSGEVQAGIQSVAPLVRRDEIEGILAVLPGYRVADAGDLRMVSRRRIPRRLLTDVLPPLIIAAALAPFWVIALWALPFVAVLALSVLIERRFHRYGLSHGFLFVQRGIWRQRQWVIPATRIQSLGLSRSWLQRRFGLMTLAIDTAGAPQLGGAQIVDLDESEGRALAEQLLEMRRRSERMAQPSAAPG